MSQQENTRDASSVPVSMARRRRIRSDALRNRRLVLRAARQLVEERGIPSMTMDALAERAGVGKGTLYRGFGSRAGLAEALVDEAERELQERILTGPPPLGWGAIPAERLVAFGRAYVELLDTNVELLVETERGEHGARFHTGAYAFWHGHVTALLKESDVDDPGLRADLLLALLSADLYHHLRRSGRTRAKLEDQIAELYSRAATA